MDIRAKLNELIRLQDEITHLNEIIITTATLYELEIRCKMDKLQWERDKLIEEIVKEAGSEL